jgi:hypothetical protein
MAENTQKEEQKTETPITETSSIIDRADAVAQRMEAANKKAEELLQRQEAIAARMMLSGRAEAGQITKTPEQAKKEEIDAKIAETLNRFKR